MDIYSTAEQLEHRGALLLKTKVFFSVILLIHALNVQLKSLY